MGLHLEQYLEGEQYLFRGHNITYPQLIDGNNCVLLYVGLGLALTLIGCTNFFTCLVGCCTGIWFSAECRYHCREVLTFCLGIPE